MRIPVIKIFAFLVTILLSGKLVAQENETARFPVRLSIPPKASFNLAGYDKENSLINDDGTQQLLTLNSLKKTWINYSSVVERNSTNTISASLSTGNVPAEVFIRLNISEDVGLGSGDMGKPSQQIILSYYPQPIITDIGSCYTGQGVEKGHLLTYSWGFASYFDPKDLNLEELSIEVNVIYTITNNE